MTIAATKGMALTKNHSTRSMTIATIVLAGLCAATLATDPSPAPCYTLVSKQCSSAWADTNRTCYSGAVAVGCEDVVLTDNPYNKVKLGSGKSEYRNAADPVQTSYYAYECGDPNLGQPTCNYLGLRVRSCLGRELDGYDCEGGGPV